MSDRQTVEQLAAALRPFAVLLQAHHEELPNERQVFGINGRNITVGDLRRAAAALDVITRKTK